MSVLHREGGTPSYKGSGGRGGSSFVEKTDGGGGGGRSSQTPSPRRRKCRLSSSRDVRSHQVAGNGESIPIEKEELLRNASGSRSERPAVRVKDVPIVPHFIPTELAQWMDDRRVELQEALSQGDDAAVLEISSKMAQGAERMVQMKSHVPDDELAMRSAPGEGRFAPY